jgi:uncharacterized glyoxalase superfamily protein PhnB
VGDGGTNNRSAPWARIVPVLVVADVRAAVAWYGEVFGLVEHVRIGEGHRAQLGFAGERAELIVSEVRPDGRRLPQEGRSHQVMLRVPDVDAVLAAAREAGADADDRSTDWEYGERQAGLVDPFGHGWVLTQTLRDVDPAEWGGESVVPRT